uniref:ArfGAP with SH3 domain, ANK repeat and PH domain-containing protein n=1 Tax=Ciona savignyi TaxID=51511 RepID=H2Y6R6_CIOSA
MKNGTKAMYNSGLGKRHLVTRQASLRTWEKLGSGAMYNSKEPEPDIGSAFLKLAVFTKELSSLFKNLVSNISNIIMFPLESLLKGDLKGVKGDMKRPFDKSWKEYDTKVKQVEREKRQLAKEAGMIRNEITGAEIAEEMEKERRMFQLQMCEVRGVVVNEIKTKKGVDLLQHLVEFYHAQDKFFTDGYKVIEHFRAYAEDLTSNLQSLRQAQEEERRQLVELKSVLKTSVSDENNSSGKGQANVYNLHQLQGNKELGTERSGFLMKRSEGLRKAWQKRKCIVVNGFLTMSHNNMNKPPVKLNLLTQLKLVSEDKKQFDLVAHNRTYRFMAEDENDAMAGIVFLILDLVKEDALNQVRGTNKNSGLKELTQSIIDEVRRLPGNERCCDCNAPEPTWLSTNLGVLLCIECSGIHRDMGVHVSRIQSITLDDLGTSELLVNQPNLSTLIKVFNPPRERKSFIRGKYMARRYVVHTCADDAACLADELGQAVRSCDVFSLVQLWAEGADLCCNLPGYVRYSAAWLFRGLPRYSTPIIFTDDGETALHVAVAMPNQDCSGAVLPLVDFLAQNIGGGMNKKTTSGNTALHLCAEMNQTECMKLLLRSKAKTDIENARGETALQVSRRMNNGGCVEILEQAASGKYRAIVHIDIDWNLTFNDEDDFISDDELDDKNLLPLPQPSSGLSPIKVRMCDPLRSASAPVPCPTCLLHPPVAPHPPYHNMRQPPRHGPPSTNYVHFSQYTFHTHHNPGKSPPHPGKNPPSQPTGTKPLNINGGSPIVGKDAPLRSKPGHPGSIEKSRSLPRTASPSELRGDVKHEAPVPLPRYGGALQVPPGPAGPPGTARPKRVKAIYDCEADNQDELTFVENEIIVVTGVEDQEWWGRPCRAPTASGWGIPRQLRPRAQRRRLALLRHFRTINQVKYALFRHHRSCDIIISDVWLICISRVLLVNAAC